jgi:hypothetical protein
METESICPDHQRMEETKRGTAVIYSLNRLAPEGLEQKGASLLHTNGLQKMLEEGAAKSDALNTRTPVNADTILAQIATLSNEERDKVAKALRLMG